MYFQQLLLLVKLRIQVARYKMDEKRRVLYIFQNDARFGRDIRRKLDDLRCQVLYVGDIGFEVLLFWRLFFLQQHHLRLEVWVFRGDRPNLEPSLTLKDDRRSAI